MLNGLSQFFMHPVMAAIGLSLIAIPIIIHLINRLQYRRVQFAAMDFLLQSQERNQRRVLFEQLLLLLMRILIVLLLTFLFARLILNPNQLSLLDQPETHHIVVLDDSGSMQDRIGDSTAYQQALSVIKELTTQLNSQGGNQSITLLQLSQPERTSANFSRASINQELLANLEDHLESLQDQCQFSSGNWQNLFPIVTEMLSSDQETQSVIHLVSDFRTRDWENEEFVTTELENLTANNARVNLIPVINSAHSNLAISQFSGDLQLAASDVPIPFQVELTNHGESVEKDISLQVLIDDEPLARSIVIPQIDPGTQLIQEFEATISQPGQHKVQVQIAADALTLDNQRFLSVSIEDRKKIFLIDGTPRTTEALYVADALSADPRITGLETRIGQLNELRQGDLSQYSVIYLINVPEIPADISPLLADYLNQGGGIAWFAGDLVQSDAYLKLAQTTESQSPSWFPIPFETSPVDLAQGDNTSPGPDLKLKDHPVFQILNAADGLLSLYVNIFKYFPLKAEESAGASSIDELIIGELKNGDPVYFEHRHGSGRLFISLTSVGPMTSDVETRWNNWPTSPNSPAFTVFHLELVKYLSAGKKQSTLTVGESLRVAIDPAIYKEQVEFLPPAESNRSPVSMLASQSPDETSDNSLSLNAIFTQTELPGFYQVIRETRAGDRESQWLAVNAPITESNLELIGSDELRKSYSGLENVLIQNVGQLQGIRPTDPGREVRMTLIILLCLLLLAEQFLAYRLSYHDSEDQLRSVKASTRNTPGLKQPRTPVISSGGRT